jgi:thiamine-monophosphate kinase
MREREVIARLRRIATSPEARGLLDDVALLGRMVVTHDTIAEGVHFLSSDPAASVGWKLIAVNLSDLAAKGATPAGGLLSLTITSSGKWELDFLSGIEAACESYGLPLLGGDTVALPEGAPRVLGLTAIGHARKRVPDRAGGRPGDSLWLIGTVGDAAAGLAQLQADRNAAGPLVDVYRRPVPLLIPGQVLAPRANAMMDVSDGLLLDAERLAQASRCRVRIHLDTLPLSAAFVEERGQDLKARLFAATGGDDYALLAALPAKVDPSTLSLPEGTTIERIGSLEAGPALVHLLYEGRPVALPERLGFEHSHDQHRRLSRRPVGHRN